MEYPTCTTCVIYLHNNKLALLILFALGFCVLELWMEGGRKDTFRVFSLSAVCFRVGHMRLMTVKVSYLNYSCHPEVKSLVQARIQLWKGTLLLSTCYHHGAKLPTASLISGNSPAQREIPEATPRYPKTSMIWFGSGESLGSTAKG